MQNYTILYYTCL